MGLGHGGLPGGVGLGGLPLGFLIGVDPGQALVCQGGRGGVRRWDRRLELSGGDRLGLWLLDGPGRVISLHLDRDFDSDFLDHFLDHLLDHHLGHGLGVGAWDLC